MRRITIILGAIFFTAIGLYLSILKRAYHPFLNLAVPFIAFGSVFYGARFGLLLSAIVSSAVIAVSICCVGFPSGFYAFSGMLLLPLVMRSAEKMFNEYKGIFQDDIKDAEQRYEDLANRRSDITRVNGDLENKISELSAIYDMAKEMSALFKLDDIMRTLARHIKKNFVCKRCVVAFVRRGDFRNSFKRNSEAYALSAREGDFEKARDMDEVTRLIGDVLSKGEDEKLFLKLSGETGATIACPLIAERNLHGFIFMDSPDNKDIEKFAILANQLALEFERIFLYEEIQELAIRDSLTGVYVRRHFMERLEEEIERSRLHNLNMPLLLFDIDHFKELNDTHGHLVGDVILREFASIIKTSIREVDLLGRYGGEEFCLTLLETSKEDALRIGERIRLSIQEKAFRAYDEDIKITTSIGVALFPKDGRDSEGLIEAADKALYRAKEAGRNIVSI